MGGKTSSPIRIVRPADGLEQEEFIKPETRRESAASVMDLYVPEVSKVGLRVCPNSGAYELEDQSGSRKRLSEEVVSWFKSRNSDTLKGSLAFVPWILQQSYFDGGLDEGKVIMHRGSGAVVFSDASGFTALTERLAKKSNGAELLSQCLTAFFTPLINLINSYRGDVIKFSGDALTIYFPAADDTSIPRTRAQVPPHGSFGLPDLGPMATAVLRASACCIEIHKRLHMFDTGVDGVKLCLHIGVGCGEVTILQVGGAIPPETHVPRFEYIIAGNPLEQISIAEPLAKNGETCVSPHAWEYVKDCVVEDDSRTIERPGFHLISKMDEQKYTFPTIKYSAMARDVRYETQFRLSELNVIRRYIPSAVFKQIEGGTLTYVNEMRDIATIFIGGAGVDVSTDDGAGVAQDLMSSVQRVCYSHEGTLNKFVIDDKGMLFLLVFGLPPLVHTDDSTRAVLSCFDMVKTFQRFQLTGRFGVTTGRAYCGVCGSAQRMEYTVLGDTVNLSARLMANAPQGGILIDEATKAVCTREVICDELPSIKVKGKTNDVAIYSPRPKGPPEFIGIDPGGDGGNVRFPWYDRPHSMAQNRKTKNEELTSSKLKENVAQLCSLKHWDGVRQVQSIIGPPFDDELHRRVSCIKRTSAERTNPPQDSPFSFGGVIVVEGVIGMGKIELAEHIVLDSAQKFGTLPVFGTMGPRLTDLERLGVELLRSTVGIYRHMDPSVPVNDLDALQVVLPQTLKNHLPQVREAFEGNADEERRRNLLTILVDLVSSLLELLRKKTPIVIVLQLEFGTSLFPKTLERFNPFWNAVTALARVAMPDGTSGVGDNPVTMVVLCKEAERSHPVVRKSIQSQWLVELDALSEANCAEYMAKYLHAPPEMVPPALQKFISKLSLGNPLYIREIIDQLISNDYINVVRDSDGSPQNIRSHSDLESINIAGWGQTAMVGNTICLLESLDPLEAAVLKMSTCFQGTFTLPDLAASTRSRWAGATHFDVLRLFRAVQALHKRGIIEITTGKKKLASPGCEEQAMPSTPMHNVASSQGQLETLEMKNMLIRKVGGSMVLESQKKVVKRQALIDRSLSRDLPARMDELRSKRLEPHIPWYYENVLARSA